MDKEKLIFEKSAFDAYDAQRLVFESCRFKSEITIENGTKRANAKSIIGVLSMKFARGDELIVSAEGEDSKEAIKGLMLFFKNL